MEDLKSRWWEFNRKDCPKIEDESDGISIQNIGGVFLVIFIGIGLGLITLAFEYYWYVYLSCRVPPPQGSKLRWREDMGGGLPKYIVPIWARGLSGKGEGNLHTKYRRSVSGYIYWYRTRVFQKQVVGLVSLLKQRKCWASQQVFFRYDTDNVQ